MVFELPQAEGTFENRSGQLRAVVQSSAWPQLEAVEQFRVANHAALQYKLKAVTAAGGEGLVLHLASAPVTTGRSDVLLKLKAVQDAEAVILGYAPGRGKYQGMLGALQVRSENGQAFRLGTGLTEQLRRNPPAVGTQVTYSFQELTPGGRPRFPRFLRVYRDD